MNNTDIKEIDGIVIDSYSNCKGLHRRCSLIVAKSNGIIKLIDFVDLNWIDVKIDKVYVDHIKALGLKGKGSIYLDIDESGLCKIIDKEWYV